MATLTRVKVLLVEDDDDDHALIRRMLAAAEGASFELEWVRNPSQASQALLLGDHDVGLLDYRLGTETGLDLLREAVAAGCPAPLILLTGWGDLGIDLAALKAGASDYLPKDRLTAELLDRSIRYALERRRTDQALRQAQKMESVGRLAGGVAHDFNNLMTVVGGYTEILLGMLPAGHPAAAAAAEVKKAQERCSALTRQLLAFSRKQRFALRAVDLNDLLKGMEGLLRPLLKADVELCLSLDDGAGSVTADPVQLEQVVMNLAVNARDAMPGGGRLVLATEVADIDEPVGRHRPGLRPGRYAVLAVGDTGSGMSPETLSHLFEPFFTTKAPGQGTGLGLATVYGIVKQSDGYVFADSEPGRGTTFRVYLPRLDPCAPEGEASPADQPVRGGSETVLAVDDEGAVRDLYRQTLEGHGYRVLVAGDAEEAASSCERHAGPIHLLLTDMVMPGIGGQELAGLLTPSRPEMRVLFVSGYAEDALAVEGWPGEGNGFLQKPFSLAELAIKVRQVLDDAEVPDRRG